MSMYSREILSFQARILAGLRRHQASEIQNGEARHDQAERTSVLCPERACVRERVNICSSSCGTMACFHVINELMFDSLLRSALVLSHVSLTLLTLHSLTSLNWQTNWHTVSIIINFNIGEFTLQYRHRTHRFGLGQPFERSFPGRVRALARSKDIRW